KIRCLAFRLALRASASVTSHTFSSNARLAPNTVNRSRQSATNLRRLAAASNSAPGRKTTISAMSALDRCCKRPGASSADLVTSADYLSHGKNGSVVHRGDTCIRRGEELFALGQQMPQNRFMGSIQPGLEVFARVAGDRCGQSIEAMLTTGAHRTHAPVDPQVDNPAARIVAARCLRFVPDQDAGEGLSQWRHVHRDGAIDSLHNLGCGLHIDSDVVRGGVVQEFSND